jgi:hypothetical protein
MPPWATKLDPKLGIPVKDNITRMGDECECDLKKLQELRQKHSHCPNVHNPPDQGCGVHFKVPYPGLAGDTKSGSAWRKARKQSIEEWRAKGHTNISDDDKLNHMTPADAGGCPYSSQNLVPTAALKDDCLEIEDTQTRLQNMLPPDGKERAKMFG